MLTKTEKLPGAADYNLQMEMNNSTENEDTILAIELLKKLSGPTRSHGLLGHGKDIKSASKSKWAEI